ncbi:MAG: FRG domain-containing protein [Acidobacteriales bacterium]|nr:FRG domain-containing protein [Terriglobales bacterium]
MSISIFGGVKNVSEFLDHVESLHKSWVVKEKPKIKGTAISLWFRGQPNANWGLVPKLQRPEYREAVEEEIRQEFKSRALQLIQGRLPANEFEWYFLMQHYGVPTRLLDWTDNPLVGLFFALDGHPGNCDAAVWALDPWWLNEKNRQADVDGPLLAEWAESEKWLLPLEVAFEGKKIAGRLPAALDPPHVDRRLQMQGSHFVIFGKERTDLATINWTRRKDCHLAKILIPSGSVKAVFEELQNCGTTYFSVFPDLNGLGEEIRRRWRLQLPAGN